MIETDTVTFDEASHTYRINGEAVPSVTQVIADIAPYPFPVDEWYLQRGKAVHACAAMIAAYVEFEHDEQIAGQVEAIRKYWREVKPVGLGVEMIVWSTKYQPFAGTLDLLAIIGGKLCVVDYKSSAYTARTMIQLGAYSMALAENTVHKPTHGIEVVYRDDGTYSASKPTLLAQHAREFMTLRAAYDIRRKLGVKETKREEG